MKSFFRDQWVSLMALFKKNQIINSILAKDYLVVLTFHRVLPEKYKNDYIMSHLALSEEEFKWVVENLKRHFPLSSLQEALVNHTDASKQASIALTFDDGQWDNYQYAFPILKNYHSTATFYIPVDYLDSQKLLYHDALSYGLFALKNDEIKKSKLMGYYEANESFHNIFSKLELKDFVNSINKESVLTFIRQLKSLSSNELNSFTKEFGLMKCPPNKEWLRSMTLQELKEMEQAGMEIASHSCQHNLLTQIEDEELLDYEIKESKLKLEKFLGVECRSFCFPNGNSNLKVKKLIASSGYQNATTTQFGLNAATAVEREIYNLNRINIADNNLYSFNGRLKEERLFYRLYKASKNLNHLPLKEN